MEGLLQRATRGGCKKCVSKERSMVDEIPEEENRRK